MLKNKLKIVWKDGLSIDITMEKNPVADYYYKCIHYLKHVELQFGARENPCHPMLSTPDVIVDTMIQSSKKVGLIIDSDQLKNQDYLNYLHGLYFDAVNKSQWDTTWLQVHDCIHLLEVINGDMPQHKDIWIDYQHKAGPLIKPFERKYLKYATTDADPGMCYIEEHELGKSPLNYQRTREINDIDTMCQTVKPWVNLKPVLNIQIIKSPGTSTFDEEAFNQWFSPYKNKWCEHWQISDWQPWEMFAKIPVGYIDDVALLVERFTNLNYPSRITQ